MGGNAAQKVESICILSFSLWSRWLKVLALALMYLKQLLTYRCVCCNLTPSSTQCILNLTTENVIKVKECNTSLTEKNTSEWFLILMVRSVLILMNFPVLLP